MDELEPAFSTVAAYFSVLSEPTRLKILHALCLGEKAVSQIVAETGATQTNVSRHHGLMHRHHVVARRRDGTQIYYRVADPPIVELCRSVCARIAGTLDKRQPMKKHFLRMLPSPKKRAA